MELGAAKILKDPDVSAVSSSVTGTVDPTSGALSIVATGTTPQRAQAVAAAYASGLRRPDPAVVQGQIDKINDRRGSTAQTASRQSGSPAGQLGHTPPRSPH